MHHRRTDLDLRLAPTGPRLMLGGRANTLSLQAANTTGGDVSVTAAADVPDGWSAERVTGSVPTADVTVLTMPVTPPVEPATAAVTVHLDSAGHETGDSRRLNLDVVPAGDRTQLALDAGTSGSPLLETYQRLSPDEGWDAERGYG